MEPRLERTQFAGMLIFAILMSSLISFSGYYDGLNADTVVAYMNSSVRWTPYFWNQDRYGMLIPALTQGLHNPMFNMIAQNILHVTCSFMCFYLLAVLLFSSSRALEIGIVAIIGYVTLSGLPDIKEFLTPWQIYTPALALGLIGLLSLPNWWLAFPIALLTGWCNFAISIFLGLLICAQAANEAGLREFQSVYRRFIQQMSFVILVFASGWIFKIPYSEKGLAGYQFSEPFEAIQGWLYLLKDYFTTAPWTSPWLPLFPAAIVLITFAWIFWVGYQYERETLRNFAVGAFTTFAYAFITGATQFAANSGYPRRYLIPSLMLWIVTCCGFILQLLPKTKSDALRQNRIAMILTMVIVILFRFGAPSLEAVSQSAARRLETRYNQIPLSCTHVAGNYYRVWESVFYSRLKGDRPLWGITYRSRVTQDLWALEQFKDPHICYWRDNEDEAMAFLEEYGIVNLTQRKLTENMVELSQPNDSIAGR